MAKRRIKRQPPKKSDYGYLKYVVLILAVTAFIVFIVMPYIKQILIGLCIALAVTIFLYFKSAKFKECVNRKFGKKKVEDVEDDVEDQMVVSKPNGKRIIEATVMPLDLRKVSTEDLTEELVRRKEIKFRGQ